MRWVLNMNSLRERADIYSWQARQSEMERWYRDLITRPFEAGPSLAEEYQPYARFLSQLSGAILDLGGGVGLARDYLIGDVWYVIVDPSTIWLDESWTRISDRFPSLKARTRFVRGVGEKLPFASGSFDVVLAFWSLNHALDPAQCIVEAHRVLKPSGRAFLVLEDMEPSWSDISRLCVQKLSERLGRSVRQPMHWHHWHQGAKRAILHKILRRPWPIQRDHLRIREYDLRIQLRDLFRVVTRRWTGGFLSYELKRSS
jgi:SAM-dependent methyltransferase